MSPKKLLILALFAAGVAAFLAFDIGHYFSLAYLKQSQASFVAYHDQRPVLVTLLFFAVYVAITAMSLPGAAIMTLAAGAGFGLVWGTVVVSFASAVGATLAMLAARTILRDSIEKRFGKRLAEVNKGVARSIYSVCG